MFRIIPPILDIKMKIKHWSYLELLHGGKIRISVDSDFIQKVRNKSSDLFSGPNHFCLRVKTLQEVYNWVTQNVVVCCRTFSLVKKKYMTRNFLQIGFKCNANKFKTTRNCNFTLGKNVLAFKINIFCIYTYIKKIENHLIYLFEKCITSC